MLGKGSCGLIQVAERRRKGMRMGRIGGFEACTFVGVVEVVGSRIGPLREFVLRGRGGGGGGGGGGSCVCLGFG